MAAKIDGFKQLSRSLEQMTNNLKSLEESNVISMDELFTVEFMKANSSFESFSDFVEASGLIDGELTQEAFDGLKQDEWEQWVTQSTHFASWETMLSEASQTWLEDKIFKNVD